MDTDIVKKILDIDENIIINDVEVSEKEVNLYIEIKKKEHICPRCGEKVNRVHYYYSQKIKDLDIFDKKAYIWIKKKRYKCNNCKKTFLEENKFLAKFQRMTNRVFNEIFSQLESEHSFKSVGKLLGLSVNTVIRAFDRLCYPKADLKNVEVVSIDEFKGNTGGEKYNCILADPKNHRVLDILPKRYNNYLTEYFKNIKKENREDIKYFISDMWSTYKEMSGIFFKEASFVVDKYHWIRQIIWAFENVRKSEQKKFYKIFRVYFKRSKSLLTKRFEFLSEEDREAVNIMLYKSENIRLAHDLKEEFLKILDCENKEEAKSSFSKWIMYAQTSGLEQFVNCSKTIMNWSRGILNSFDTPYTNGFIEGCNNKIKVLKRNAYGYRNFERFRNRILHMFSSKGTY